MEVEAAFWGADTDALIAMGHRCRTAGEQLRAMAEDFTREVSAGRWTGPDADAFRERWETSRAQLSDASGDIDATAEFLGREADEQDLASDPSGRIDAERYGDLIGGSFGWSDLINTAERISDLWRDDVMTDSMGGAWKDAHPDWRPESVPLDPSSIRAARMQQGTLGDCWFLAALMAVQQTDPDLLSRNISPQGQPPGSQGWTVSLHVDGEWKDVHVAPEQIAIEGARSASSTGGHDDAGIGFMSIYEQAMINECEGQPSRVSADSPAHGLEMITGRRIDESDTSGQPSFEDCKRAIDEHRPVTVMSDPIKPLGDGGQLVSAHVHQVSGYDESTHEIILTNPHGPHAASTYQVRVKPGAPGGVRVTFRRRGAET